MVFDKGVRVGEEILLSKDFGKQPNDQIQTTDFEVLGAYPPDAPVWVPWQRDDLGWYITFAVITV